MSWTAKTRTSAASPSFRRLEMRLDRLSVRALAWSLACCLMLVGCQPGKRLTKANVDQVAVGMAKKQVESILGMPSSVDTKDYEVKQKTTYLYTQGRDTVTIVFWEDKVESKETTLTE